MARITPFVGMDVHAETIAVAIAKGAEPPVPSAPSAIAQRRSASSSAAAWWQWVRGLKMPIASRIPLGFIPSSKFRNEHPFFAVVKLGGATIALREVASDVPPMPNCSRHEWARGDAFVNTLSPDLPYEEYCANGVTIHRPIADTEEGRRAFEVRDINGYVRCFGRSLKEA